MDQPLFSCTKCFHNFPQSEMSRSGQTCRSCNPHHSSFKQCEYCKSDFKYSLPGPICPKCQSMKSKYGDPHPCSICMLLMSFGNALVCQRCLHYKNRFGEPRECQNCGQPSAFVKDEESRQKVNGQILCWVCTYNFKLARSREQSEHGSLRKKHSHGHQGRRTEKMPEGSFAKRSRTMEEFSRNSSSLDDSLGHHVGGIPNTALGVGQIPAPVQAYNMDSVYNEHILTISRLQDEIKNLKKQLSQKSADMIAKDRVIADLKSDIFTKECAQRDKMSRIQHEMENETEKLSSVIRQLRRENLTLVQSLRKRKSGGLTGTQAATAALIFNPLRPCSSAVNLTAGIETAASSSKHQSLISSGELLVVRSANVGGDISPAPSTSSENCDAEVDGAGSHGESATPAASNGAISDAISEEEEDVSKIKEGSHIHRRAKPEKEVLKSIEGNLPGDHCAFSFSIGITPVSPVCSLVDAAQPAVTAYSASDQIVSSILPTPYDEKYDINSLTRKSALSGRSVSPAQSVGSSASSRSVVSLASSRSSKSHSQLHPIAAVSSTEGHLVCSSDSDDCAEAQGESEQEAEASGVLVLSTKSTGDSKRILMASQPQFSP